MTSPVPAEREAFEAHVLSETADETLIRRRDDPGSSRRDEYVNENVQRLWLGWQARAALAERPASPPPTVALTEQQLLAEWQDASGRTHLTESERIDLLQLICAASATPSRSPADGARGFDHLAGRGMHELRFDELADYVMSIAGDADAQREAVAWIVSELERKTNDEGVLAFKLADARETDAQVSDERRWIPVTERLPQYDETAKVLAYTRDNDYAGVQFHHIPVLDFYDYHPDDDDIGTELANTVTHWMPEPWPPGDESLPAVASHQPAPQEPSDSESNAYMRDHAESQQPAPQEPGDATLKDAIRRAEISHSGMSYGDDKRGGPSDYAKGWGDCLRMFKTAATPMQRRPSWRALPSDDDERSYNAQGAPQEPVAHCNLHMWGDGSYEAQDCFSDKPFEGSSPLYATPQKESEQPDTVHWPVVMRYSGGAAPEGVYGRVWLKLNDDIGSEVEYVPAGKDAALLADGGETA